MTERRDYSPIIFNGRLSYESETDEEEDGDLKVLPFEADPLEGSQYNPLDPDPPGYRWSRSWYKLWQDTPAGKAVNNLKLPKKYRKLLKIGEFEPEPTQAGEEPEPEQAGEEPAPEQAGQDFQLIENQNAESEDPTTSVGSRA